MLKNKENLISQTSRNDTWCYLTKFILSKTQWSNHIKKVLSIVTIENFLAMKKMNDK